MNTINIVIPMAGAGSRFAKAGYTIPKPFINVLGKPMICHVLENLNMPDARFILLARKEHYDNQRETVGWIKAHYAAEFVLIDKLTEGAACTVLHAHRLIDNDTPLLIANSDQIVDMDIEDFIHDSDRRGLDGSVLCFEDSDPKWSFTKLDENGLITMIREKEPISENATVGIYYFHEGRDFVENAIDMLVRNERVNNEFYVAPVYNYAIEQGRRFGIYSIDKNRMHGTGTPEDLDKYIFEIKGSNVIVQNKQDFTEMLALINKNPSNYKIIAVGSEKRYQANKLLLGDKCSYQKDDLNITKKDADLIVVCGEYVPKTEHDIPVFHISDLINCRAKLFWDQKKEYIGVDLNHSGSNQYIAEFLSKKNPAGMFEILEKHCKGKNNLSALSIGCGCGALERDLLTLGYFSKIHGTDISDESLKVAKEKAERVDKDGVIQYFKHDANNDEYREKYDVIIAVSCVHHIERLEFFYASVRKALKPDGIFLQFEYTGAARFQHPPVLVSTVNFILSLLDSKHKIKEKYEAPLLIHHMAADPSEACRSDEIEELTKKVFPNTKIYKIYDIMIHLFYQCINPDSFKNNKRRTLKWCGVLYYIEKALCGLKVIKNSDAILVSKG